MNKDNIEQKSWMDFFALTYFHKLIEKKHQSDNNPDTFHLLDDEESKAIRKITYWAMFKSALCGIIGVFVLYIPYYIFGDSLFPDTYITFPWFGTLPVPIIFSIYGMVLVIPELYALTIINLNAVYKIAKVCGYPSRDDPNYNKHLKDLYQVGTYQQSKEMAIYGIDPFAGWSRSYTFMVVWVNRLKGAITNVISKFILSRVLGRIILRYFIDMIGVIVYAFWNARATRQVIREAKVRIMAPFLIEKMTDVLHEDFKADEGFRDFLHNVLQLIAVVKREYHHNHYFLVEQLIRQFDLGYESKTVLPKEQIIQQAQQLQPKTQEGVAKLLIFGMLIDGHLTKREKRVLQELEKTYSINYDWKTLKSWEYSFFNGQGLEELFQANILNIEGAFDEKTNHK